MFKSIFGLFLSVAIAFAQTTGTAILVGTVTDNTGAVVPGASVKIVNTETQFVYNGLTSPEGAYYVPNLIPGTYRLTIEATGFKRYIREGVILRTSEQPRCSKPRPLLQDRFLRATRSSKSPFCRSMPSGFFCICPRPPTSTANT